MSTALLLVESIVSFLNIYLIIIFVRLLLTWFPNIDWMQQIVGFLSPITDPYLNLFRFIPPMGTIDISSIFAILALQVAMQLIPQLAAPLTMGL
jgi:YggT family protein